MIFFQLSLWYFIFLWYLLKIVFSAAELYGYLLWTLPLVLQQHLLLLSNRHFPKLNHFSLILLCLTVLFIFKETDCSSCRWTIWELHYRKNSSRMPCLVDLYMSDTSYKISVKIETSYYTHREDGILKYEYPRACKATILFYMQLEVRTVKKQERQKMLFILYSFWGRSNGNLWSFSIASFEDDFSRSFKKICSWILTSIPKTRWDRPFE